MTGYMESVQLKDLLLEDGEAEVKSWNQSNDERIGATRPNHLPWMMAPNVQGLQVQYMCGAAGRAFKKCERVLKCCCFNSSLNLRTAQDRGFALNNFLWIASQPLSLVNEAAKTNLSTRDSAAQCCGYMLHVDDSTLFLGSGSASRTCWNPNHLVHKYTLATDDKHRFSYTAIELTRFIEMRLPATRFVWLLATPPRLISERTSFWSTPTSCSFFLFPLANMEILCIPLSPFIP